MQVGQADDLFGQLQIHSVSQVFGNDDVGVDCPDKYRRDNKVDTIYGLKEQLEKIRKDTIFKVQLWTEPREVGEGGTAEHPHQGAYRGQEGADHCLQF